MENEAISVNQRVFHGLTLGSIAYFAFGALPYFPLWVIYLLSLLTLILGAFSAKGAIGLIVAGFGLILAYHAYDLFILYAVLIFFISLYIVHQPFLPKMFLVVAGAPCLSYLMVANFTIPLEFLIVLIAPMLLKKEQATAAAGLAYLWCAVLGILSQQALMGNLIIGQPYALFYTLRPAAGAFYDISWLGDKLATFPLQNLITTVTNLAIFLLSHPLLLVQAGLWAITSYAIGSIMEKRHWYLNLGATALGVAMITLSQLMTVWLEPEGIDFDFALFVILVVPTMIAAFIVFELYQLAASRKKVLPLGVKQVRPATPVRPKTDQEPYQVKDTLSYQPRRKAQQATPLSPENERVKEFLKNKRPSLEESIRMQRDLGDYIKKRFVHEVTALAIDVVASMKLKSGELEEEVIVAFTEYWRFVDGATWRRQGRLLNRAGDGAVYVFNYADQAVLASQDVLKGLPKFNRRSNPLKSPFQVRIGLNTGRIVEDSSTGGSDVFSRVLDVAAHLQEAAPPGGVFISTATYEKLTRSKKQFVLKEHSERDHTDIYILQQNPR